MHAKKLVAVMFVAFSSAGALRAQEKPVPILVGAQPSPALRKPHARHSAPPPLAPAELKRITALAHLAGPLKPSFTVTPNQPIASNAAWLQYDQARSMRPDEKTGAVVFDVAAKSTRGEDAPSVTAVLAQAASGVDYVFDCTVGEEGTNAGSPVFLVNGSEMSPQAGHLLAALRGPGLIGITVSAAERTKGHDMWVLYGCTISSTN